MAPAKTKRSLLGSFIVLIAVVGASLTAGGVANAQPAVGASAASRAAESKIDSIIEYTGFLNRIADDERSGSRGQEDVLFTVDDLGYLAVDISGLPPADRSGRLTVTIALPEGLTLSGGDSARFQQLVDYSAASGALVVVKTARAGSTTGQFGASVTQTPADPAVHRVYVANVSPSNGITQTYSWTISDSIALASQYWQAQSNTDVTFELSGTTKWYSSDYSCKTASGVAALWNEAAKKAKTQLGYVPGHNVHLVLFLDQYAHCGGAIGRGSLGGSVNDGGVAWVKDNFYDKQLIASVLAQQLGHNMSLGGADWLECSSSTPTVGAAFVNPETSTSWATIDNCEINYAGDISDVMGYPIGYARSGALSSPQAIRAGIWPDNVWATAPIGTTTYQLNPVGKHVNPGLSSVVVQDSDGTNYFVEFRNFTGDDADLAEFDCYPEAGSGGGGACIGDVPNQTGVRILRMEPSGYQGLPGYDSFLIGRTVSGIDKVRYAAGDTFWSQPGNTGIRISVTAMTGTAATIEVERAPHGITSGVVEVYPTVAYDSQMRIDDTLTAFLGDTWNAESYAYQWMRSEHGSDVVTDIDGATSQSYRTSIDDLGLDVRVRVTASTAGESDVVVTSASYGAMGEGHYDVDQPGTVHIDNSTTPMVAVPTDWPEGTEFVAFQWIRQDGDYPFPMTKITGATTDSYTPTLADDRNALMVDVTVKIPGYVGTYTRRSVWRLFGLHASTDLVINAPVLKIGEEIQLWTLPTFTAEGGSHPPTDLTIQWLRNGSVVATGLTYKFQPADLGQTIRARVYAVAPGWPPTMTKPSPGVIPTIKGDIQGTLAPPTLVKTITGTGFTLTATFDPDAITEPNVKYSYQWYRVPATGPAVAITDQTKKTYTPTSADRKYQLKVRVKVTRTNYNTVTLTSDPLGVSLLAPRPVIVGDQHVGGVVTIADREYTDSETGAPVTPSSITYQWYRSGTAIGTASTTPDHLITSGDKGKRLTVKVVAKFPGLLGVTATSASTQVIGTLALDGADAQPNATVIVDPISTASSTTLRVTDTGITGPDPLKVAYQWYRGSTAITGATKATFVLSSADRGKLVWVRVTTSKAAIGSTTFTTVVKYSLKRDYSLVADGAATVATDGTPQAGEIVSATAPSYFESDGVTPVTVELSYTWYRGTNVITGQGDVDYQLMPADVGHTIKVKVTARAAGYVYLSLTSAKTPVIS